MDPVWNILSQTCNKNEAQMKELGERLSSLPREPVSWFYLNADLLCPLSSKSSDSDPSFQQSVDADSFVSILRVRKQADGASQDLQSKLGACLKRMEEDENTLVAQGTDVQHRNLQEVFCDPNFTEPIMKLIKMKELEPSLSLNESDTVSFCRYLLDSEVYISEDTGTYLFNLILYPVICNVQKMFLSVLLLEKIRELSNKFPTFMMNGVIIPGITNDDLEKQVLDIICDILGGLTEENLNSTLKRFLTSLKRNDENSVKLLATVFRKKPKLDNEMAFSVVTKLHNLSEQFSSSIQFGKLLLEGIPLLNAKLSVSSLKILKTILNHHTSFLKASTLKLFNNLTHL